LSLVILPFLGGGRYQIEVFRLVFWGFKAIFFCCRPMLKSFEWRSIRLYFV
jgi:hypothetical protein